MLDIPLLMAGALAAGALGGLLGIGGGIVLMPLLRFGVGLSPAAAAGTCIIAVFFTTLGGSFRYYRMGHIDPRSIMPVVVSGAVASGVSSWMFGYLAVHGRWLDLGVGIVFTLVSVRMIVEGIPGLVRDKTGLNFCGTVGGTVPQKAAVGAVAGILPGLLGVGTGSILVPAFTFLLRTPIKTAMAASLACFCLNALVSSFFKLAQGFIDLTIALPICAGTLIGANLGAIVNKRFPSGALKLLFGLVFSYVSLRFILSFFELII